MAGDPEKANVWAYGDVYVSFDPSPTVPTDENTPFNGDWEAVGLLDGDGGFSEGVSETSTSHRAWGYGTIKKTHKDLEVTVSFTALEDNDTVERLSRPGLHEPVFVAFETREGSTVRRRISRVAADITRNGDKVDNEAGLAQVPLIATVFPDTDIDVEDENMHFIEQPAYGGS